MDYAEARERSWSASWNVQFSRGSASQGKQGRQPPAYEQVVAKVLDEGAGGAEELVEHEDAPDVTVERVLGRDADAGRQLHDGVDVVPGHPDGIPSDQLLDLDDSAMC